MTTNELRSFFRPSRSGGLGHAITLDARTLQPVDAEHPCSCPAGMNGRPCWALREVWTEVAGGMADEDMAAVFAALEAR
jgi:hypothetical protein